MTASQANGQRPQHHQIAIIGAGFAGMGMGIQLKKRGTHDFVIFERAQEVGGTWRDNTYPGCACDIKSDLYSYSFAPNPDWSHDYARQPEILAYLNTIADDFGLRPHLRFGHEVEEARWNSEAGLWHIRTAGGEYTARALISGHGPLIDPKWPDIPGLDHFTGEKFHSARWNHQLDLRGRRIAVIGTGASAIQFVPHLQRVAAHLDVYQRTPPWVMPRHDRPTNPRRRALFRRYPALQRWSRQLIFAVTEARFLAFTSPQIGAVGEQQALAHLNKQVRDPALRAQLTPNYRLGCKRILISDDYYPALSQPNVGLVTTAIHEVRGNAVVTADGQARHYDVLIGGTGFNVTQPPAARVVYGKGGQSLSETWSDHMEALHGTAVSGFPNFFMLIGPNTVLGHNSIVYMIEAQVDYILQALDYLDQAQVQSIEPKSRAQRVYNDTLQAKLRQSVWVRGGCTSYYLDHTGRNSTLWPELASRFRQTLSRFTPNLYDVTLSPTPPQPVLARPPV